MRSLATNVAGIANMTLQVLRRRLTPSCNADADQLDGNIRPAPASTCIYKMAPPHATPQTIDADLCVVGAGIVGLAHAHEARRRGPARRAARARRPRGRRERAQLRPRCSSPASATASDLECALRARERWLELGRRAGDLDARRRHARRRPRRGRARGARGRAADPRAARAMLTPPRPASWRRSRPTSCSAAMHGDARPARRPAQRRRRPGARCSSGRPGARVEWGTPVHEVEPGAGPRRPAARCARRGSSSARVPTTASLPPGCDDGLDAADAVHSCRCCASRRPAGAATSRRWRPA